MSGDQFDGRAGADQKGRVLTEAGKKLVGERHGRVRNGYGAAANIGVGADFLRD